LSQGQKAAINFHPAPPEYPGIGCYNFALYDQVTGYGVTCHHMAKRVDTGKIIKVSRFPVFPTDTVDSLKERSMAYLLTLFYEIASLVIAEKPLPVSSETWVRKPYTRKELDALCRIVPDMTPKEVHRRVRATFYPGYPGPYVELADYKFKL
jgi:methionyl-tRNA formyltransferase